MKTRHLLVLPVCLMMMKPVSGQFTISVVGSNDVCGPSVPIQVDAPDPNFTYEWYVSTYDCSGMGTPMPYGQAGSMMTAYGTGEYVCFANPVIGGPAMISNPVNVRVNLTSVGFMHLPAPYPVPYVVCAPSLPLCVPTAFYSMFSGTSFQWYRDNTPIAGATGASYTATLSGWYKYTLTTSCMSDYSDSVQFISSSSPSINLTGGGTVCNGGSASICINGPFVSYLWSTGETTSCITVTTSGTYTVTATTNAGCTSTGSASVNFVAALPVQITASDTTLCLGQAVYLDATTPTAMGYAWNNGATTPGIFVTDTGSYSVSVWDANGCSGLGAITLYPEPPYPTTILAGGTLNICLGDSVELIAPSPPMGFYQWFRNNVPIPNALSQIYWAKSSGRYRCLTHDMSGCPGLSNQLRVRVVCFPPQDPVDRVAEPENPIVLFPNPTHDQVLIIAPPAGVYPFVCTLSDLSGSEVARYYLEKNETRIDLSWLPPGVYPVMISDNLEIYHTKLVKY